MAALPKFNFTLPVLQVVGSSAAAVHKMSPTATVFRAAIDMIKGRLSSVVVADQGGMAGILTERDFLKLGFEKGQSRETLVSEIMTPASMIKTAPSTYTTAKCVAVMRKNKVRTLPILEKGEIKALLSMQDISHHVATKMLLNADPRGDDLTNLTVGDLLDDPNINTPNINDISLPSKASVAEAVERMREASSGSLLVRIPGLFMPFSAQVREYLKYEDEGDALTLNGTMCCSLEFSPNAILYMRWPHSTRQAHTTSSWRRLLASPLAPPKPR